MKFGSRATWLYITLVATGLMVASVACKSDGSNKAGDDGAAASAESPEKKGGEESADKGAEGDEQDKEAKKAKEAPPADLYAGMQFDRLKPDERIEFVEVAKAELCPCDEAAESLHVCLQDEAKQCPMAKRAATLIAAGIRQGVASNDLHDRLATFMEQAKREYEFDLEDVPRKGPADAPVQVVEFADFECPHCKRASRTLGALQEQMSDKVAIYFFHYPLPGHPKAEMAARAAEAARQQGKFWRMHDLIFEHQTSLGQDKVFGFARQIGLNFSKFKKDIDSTEVAKAVQQNKQRGREVEVSSTPTIFVNGHRHMGNLSKESLMQAIDLAHEEATGGSDEKKEKEGTEEEKGGAEK